MRRIVCFTAAALSLDIPMPQGRWESGVFYGNSGTWVPMYHDVACSVVVEESRPFIWLCQTGTELLVAFIAFLQRYDSPCDAATGRTAAPSALPETVIVLSCPSVHSSAKRSESAKSIQTSAPLFNPSGVNSTENRMSKSGSMSCMRRVAMATEAPPLTISETMQRRYPSCETIVDDAYRFGDRF